MVEANYNSLYNPNYKPKYTFYFPGHVVLLYDMIYDIKGAVPFSSKIFLAQKKIAKSILFAENESVKSIKKGNGPYVYRYHLPSFPNFSTIWVN